MNGNAAYCCYLKKKHALLTNLQATNSVTSEELGFTNLSYAALHCADRVEFGWGTVKWSFWWKLRKTALGWTASEFDVNSRNQTSKQKNRALTILFVTFVTDWLIAWSRLVSWLVNLVSRFHVTLVFRDGDVGSGDEICAMHQVPACSHVEGPWVQWKR